MRTGRHLTHTYFSSPSCTHLSKTLSLSVIPQIKHFNVIFIPPRFITNTSISNDILVPITVMLACPASFFEKRFPTSGNDKLCRLIYERLSKLIIMPVRLSLSQSCQGQGYASWTRMLLTPYLFPDR